MEISYGSRKMQRLCSDEKALKNALGKELARKVMLRLTEVEAAQTLNDLRHLPQARCQPHPTALGRLTVALLGSHRLLLEADEEPLPVECGGGLDWAQVARVRVLAISGPPAALRNEGEGDVEEAFRA